MNMCTVEKSYSEQVDNIWIQEVNAKFQSRHGNLSRDINETVFMSKTINIK